MEKTVIKVKISGLRLYYRWFSILYFVTRQKYFFDKKIKVGIMILSFMSVLTSCKQVKVPEVTCYEMRQNAARDEAIPKEQSPVFRGGEEELNKYIENNVNYPEEAKVKNITGIVIVCFIVRKDGKINDVTILSGIGGGCDEEAMRVVKKYAKMDTGKAKR